MALTEAQEDANGLVDDLVELAVHSGWTAEQRGVTDDYAWVLLSHPLKEKIQAFYAVDETKRNDRFMYDIVSFGQAVLRAFVEADDSQKLRSALTKAATRAGEVDTYVARYDAALVAMNNAAHSAAHTVPPTMPPTVHEAANAAHQRAAHSAAHTDSAVPPTGDGNAAHRDIEAEDRKWIRQEAKAHFEQAGDPASQLDTIAAVEAQQAMGGSRNWSAVASPMTSDELLASLPGKTITFRNRVSGRREQVTVCTSREATRHTPKITPADFDAEAAGEDLRIVHFLELGAGFRSIAVSQITEIS